MSLSLALALALAPQAAADQADQPHIVFVTGDEEYRSEESMPMLAELLEREYGCRCTVLYAQDEQGYIAPNTLDNIPGLEALDDADLMVQFTRFRALPDDQLQHILDYAASGRPMVGFRTATHAFRYPQGSPNAHWNDDYSVEYFGQKWITHHGHSSTTRVFPRKQLKDHPVLRGVKGFEAPSWLYHVDGGGDHLPADALVLADGLSLHSEHGEAQADRFPLSQPIAWVRERENGQRVFFTTLGHPFDFQQDAMRTLALNGILWALGLEDRIPSHGCDPTLLTPYTPTKDAYGGAIPGRRPQPLPQHWTPRQGARIALVGNTMAERMSFYPNFEVYLNLAFPDRELHVRNLGWSADTPSLQPRPLDFGSMEDHLAAVQADTVFACFGLNESFAGAEGLPAFRHDLEQFVRRVRSRRLADGSYPEIILVSPKAPENLGGRWPANLALIEAMQPYVDTMEEVARRCQLRFLDVFSVDAFGADGSVTPPEERLTIDGIHLNARGYEDLAASLMLLLTGDLPFPDERYRPLMAETQEKARQWWYRHRAINGYYIYGGRKDPFGSVSFPGEMARLDALVEAHDRRIHALAEGADPDALAPIDMEALPPLPTIASNYQADITILPPAEAEAAMEVAAGYRAKIFASEVDFPELENPVALTFDAKGRLWVSVMPTYPQILPGATPEGKLLILEDTDGDGHADRRTVFADHLYLPAGFELGDGGAYVAQQPYLVFLKDLDDDDHADTKEIMLEGFGTEDAHHAISAFTWGPGGGLYMQEGTFHHSQVETIYGPVRVKDGAVFRWEPHTGRLRVHAPWGFWNPWGHVFDAWGQDYIGDASDGNNYLAAAMITDKEYDRYRRGLESFTTARVRPTGGSEIITGHGFPEAVQGDYLISNTIGFQGIRAHHLRADGSGVMAESHWDLMSSRDSNFRPIDMQFGPDGALYVVDWFNPLIGHMQHSIRDPKRDHTHGRIWRVSYVGDEAAPAQAPDLAALAKRDLGTLSEVELDRLLQDSDNRLRYRVRREFRLRDAEAIDRAFDASPPQDEHHDLERTWVREQTGILDLIQLAELWGSSDERIRAAVVRLVNMEHEQPQMAAQLDGVLHAASRDRSGRVRLEALNLATRMPGPAAVEALMTIMEQPTDRWLDYAIEQAILFLKPTWIQELSVPGPMAYRHPEAWRSLMEGLDTPTLAAMPPFGPIPSILLMRPDATPEQRLAALTKLSSDGDQVDPELAVGHWLEALQAADALPDDRPSGLIELLPLLSPAGLREQGAALAKLAADGRRAESRVAALTALMRVTEADAQPPLDAATPPDELWRLAANDAPRMLDSLEAARLAGPVGARARADYLAMLATAPSAWPGCPEATRPSVQGRYLRVELDGARPLTLAEVEVWSGGQNIAGRGQATQASEAWGGVPSRAIDGNHSGAWNDGSQTHTAEGGQDPWWQLDLGADFPIEQIVLWNRTDEQLGQRLDNYRLRLLDSQGREVWKVERQPAPTPMSRHVLRIDWPQRVQRGALRALAAGKQAPFIPRFGDIVVGILQEVPLQERGQAWFSEARAYLPILGRQEAAAKLLVQTAELKLSGLPLRADGPPLDFAAIAPIEIAVHNDSDRWVAMAVLPRQQLATLTQDAPQARMQHDPALRRGHEVFQMHCLTCHAPDGGGLVGPNMTDDHYLHLQRPEEMPPLIRDGFLEKGMTPFKDILTEAQIADAAAYLAALRGTVPASPKEVQGSLVPPWEAPADRLARLGLTPIEQTEAIAPGGTAYLRFALAEATAELVVVGTLPGQEALQLALEIGDAPAWQ